MASKSEWTKYQKAIRAQARAEGWRETETKDGWMLYPPDRTKPAVAVHKTATGPRSIENNRAAFRRSGLKGDPK